MEIFSQIMLEFILIVLFNDTPVFGVSLWSGCNKAVVCAILSMRYAYKRSLAADPLLLYHMTDAI